MCRLPSTLRNKKFHKPVDRNGTRGEITYHFSSIDRSHYVLFSNIREPPKTTQTHTTSGSIVQKGNPGKPQKCSLHQLKKNEAVCNST